jgi:hypothetical protein
MREYGGGLAQLVTDLVDEVLVNHGDLEEFHGAARSLAKEWVKNVLPET